MNNLEKRIREVASKMEGKFMDEDSTDEEIEDCILYREKCCDEYYKDEVGAYGLV